MLKIFQDHPPSGSRPRFLTTSREVNYDSGFYHAENDGLQDYRWMNDRGKLTFSPIKVSHFLEMPIFSSFKDLSQELTVETQGKTSSMPLIHAWHTLSWEVPSGAYEATLQVNRLIPQSELGEDLRSLGIRVGTPSLHLDGERHAHISAMIRNGILNREELLAGRTFLQSTPPILGIDIHGVCNIKPPCVYCDWDSAKAKEGDFTHAPFTPKTLEAWGSFFDHASVLNSCGIGEPFMMKDIDPILDIFGDRGKYLEMSTNGQILTDRNIQRLLGRRVELYISLDAANPETYAKLRNNHFEKILENVKRLISAKGGQNQYPLVRLVFMPMKVNVEELEEFVKLCAHLGVDSMVLRPLGCYEEPNLVWERAGYRFVYEEELLPFSELIRVSGAAAEYCKQYGVVLHDQLDFGDASMKEYFPEDFEKGRQGAAAPSESEDSTPAPVPTRQPPVTESNPIVNSREFESREVRPQAELPICLEPWERLYILRRGILPCSYGDRALAPMDHWAESWNSDILQAIRKDLLVDRLHPYCVESSSCPIVQKRKEAGKLQSGFSQQSRFHLLLQQVPGFFFELPRFIFRAVKRISYLLARVFTPSD